MNNVSKNSFIAAAFMVAFSASAVTNGNSAIQFEGAVNESGCEVVVAPSHNQATVSAATINLKTVDKASLGREVGSTANKTAFALTLSNCPLTMSTVAANFDYVPSTVNESYLKNLEAVDNGVAMQMFDDKDSGKALIKGVVSQPVNLQGGNAILPFSVALVNTVGEGVSAGKVSANTQYTIIYQ